MSLYSMDDQSSMSNSLIASSLHVANELLPLDNIKVECEEGDEGDEHSVSADQTEAVGIADPSSSRGCERVILKVKPFAKLAELNTSSSQVPLLNAATAYYFNGAHYVKCPEATIPPQTLDIPENRLAHVSEDPAHRNMSAFCNRKAFEVADIKDESLVSTVQSTSSQPSSRGPDHSSIVVKSEVDFGIDAIPCSQKGEVEHCVPTDIEIQNSQIVKQKISAPVKRKKSTDSNTPCELVKSLPQYDPLGVRVCKACGFRTKDDEVLTTHSKNFHTREDQFKCLQCPSKHPSLNHLICHYSRVHLGEELRQCRTCGAGFKARASYSRHKKNCLPKKPYACHKCELTFKHESYLKRHLRSQTHAVEVKVPCPYCDKTVRRGWLDTHIKIQHYRERNYVCDVCNRDYGTKYELAKHHKDHRLYPCKLCDYRGTCEMLFSHMSTHEEVFTCDECGRKFFTEKMFLNHQSMHKMPKKQQFVCQFEECKAAFALRINLKVHYSRTKHNWPYHCVKCNRRFAQEFALINHNKRHQDGSELIPNVKYSDGDSIEARVAQFGSWLGISTIEGELSENDTIIDDRPSSATIQLDDEQKLDKFDGITSASAETVQTTTGRNFSSSTIIVDQNEPRASCSERIPERILEHESVDNENHHTVDPKPYIPDIGGYLECQVECGETFLNEASQAIGMQTNGQTVNQLNGEIGCLVEIKQEIPDTDDSVADFAIMAVKNEEDTCN